MLNRNVELNNTIRDTIQLHVELGAKIDDFKIQLNSLANNKAYAHELHRITQQIYISLDDVLNNALSKTPAIPSAEVDAVLKTLETIKIYLITLKTKLSEAAQPEKNLSAEHIREIPKKIEKHIKKIEAMLPLEEEDDEEEEKENQPPSITAVNEETSEAEEEEQEYASDASESDPEEASSEVTSDNDETDEEDSEDHVSEAEETASDIEPEEEPTEALLDASLSDILSRMQKKINTRKEAISAEATRLTEENKVLHKKFTNYTKYIDALQEQETKIKNSIFRRKKNRETIPAQIKESEEKASEYYAKHSKNVATLKQLRADYIELEFLEPYFSALTKILAIYQQNVDFNTEACKDDLIEIENTLKSFLNNANRREKIAKEKITNLIAAANNTHASAGVRKKNFLEAIQNQNEAKKKPEDEYDPGLPLDTRQLLVRINTRREESQRAYNNLLKAQKAHLDGTKRLDDYAKHLRSMTFMEILLSNLNQLEMILLNNSQESFFQFAKEEIMKSPTGDFNQNMGLIFVWAREALLHAERLTEEELNMVLSNSNLPIKKEPTFLQKLWRNKFTILFSLAGFLGGIALGYFTFGLSLQMTAQSIAIFVAAVGGSGIGNGITQGLLGYLIDLWLAPDDKPVLAEEQHAPDANLDRFRLQEEDDDEETNNHQPALQHNREKKEVNVSGARNSFMKEDQSRRATNDNVIIDVRPGNENNNQGYRP